MNIGDIGETKTAGVTGGISEALVSLVVAIFVFIFANTFRALDRRQIAIIQEYGGELEIVVNFMDKYPLN